MVIVEKLEINKKQIKITKPNYLDVSVMNILAIFFQYFSKHFLHIYF